jgi:hypothetical protein
MVPKLGKQPNRNGTYINLNYSGLCHWEREHMNLIGFSREEA